MTPPVVLSLGLIVCTLSLVLVGRTAWQEQSHTSEVNVAESTTHQTQNPLLNDNLENATKIDQLPFATNVDSSPATLESHEPVASCVSPQRIGSTIWYSFRADREIQLSIETDSLEFPSTISVWLAEGAQSLRETACVEISKANHLSFQARDDQYYLIQIGGLLDSSINSGGQLAVKVEEITLVDCPSGGHSYSDEANDTLNPQAEGFDISAVQVSANESVICITVEMDIPDGWDLSLPRPDFYASLVFDLDLDPHTGAAGQQGPCSNDWRQGTDSYANIAGWLGHHLRIWHLPSSTLADSEQMTVGDGIAYFERASVRILMPQERIDDDGVMSVGISVGTSSGATDCVPNDGSLNIQSASS